VSLAAAAGGLFSVLSYAVGRRRREFGIRIALGARASQIRRLVVGDGLIVAAIGLTLGAALSWVVSRAIVSLAFGVTIGAPWVWAVTIAAVAATTLLAAWRPAAVAMRTDPLALLRDD
jgi:putative ABC transport system permease protein